MAAQEEAAGVAEHGVGLDHDGGSVDGDVGGRVVRVDGEVETGVERGLEDEEVVGVEAGVEGGEGVESVAGVEEPGVGVESLDRLREEKVAGREGGDVHDVEGEIDLRFEVEAEVVDVGRDRAERRGSRALDRRFGRGGGSGGPGWGGALLADGFDAFLAVVKDAVGEGAGAEPEGIGLGGLAEAEADLLVGGPGDLLDEGLLVGGVGRVEGALAVAGGEAVGTAKVEERGGHGECSGREWFARPTTSRGGQAVVTGGDDSARRGWGRAGCSGGEEGEGRGRRAPGRIGCG